MLSQSDSQDSSACFPAPSPVSSSISRNTINRVRAIMMHIPWYTFEPGVRLATDTGLARSTISRLLRGQRSPSLRVATAVTDALSRRLGRSIPMNEIFSTDGGFPTPSTCELCRGACVTCTPEFAYDSRDRLKAEYRDMAPGDWCLYPKTTTSDILTATVVPAE